MFIGDRFQAQGGARCTLKSHVLKRHSRSTTMSDSMEEAPLWERAKENAAPLERGRNVAALENSFAVHTTKQSLENERKIQQYERLVQPSESETYTLETNKNNKPENDPLLNWLSYIKFYQTAFPSDTHNEFLLLERCMRALYKIPQYANNERFIRVACLYADKTDVPAEVFMHLYRQKVGSHVAIFWIAWAFVAEKQEDFSLAEKIYEKGIRKNAQHDGALRYLLQRQKQFQRRLRRHCLNAAARIEHGDDDMMEGDQQQRRGALGALSEDSFRRNDRSRNAHNVLNNRTRAGPPPSSNLETFMDRSAVRGRPVTSGNDNNVGSSAVGGFTIFTESNEENSFNPLDESSIDHGHSRRLEREGDRKKENILAAERWNDRGGFASSYGHAPPTAPPVRAHAPFAVFVDDDCAAQHEREEENRRQNSNRQRCNRDERFFREREDDGMAEKLAKDPLRYVRDPSKLEADQSICQEPEQKDRKVGAKTSKNKKSKTAVTFTNSLLRDENGKEQCYEEARALAAYYRVIPSATNINFFFIAASGDCSNSCMSMDDSHSMEEVSMVSMEESKQPPSCPRVRDSKVKTMRSGRQELSFEALTPKNTSTASSTVDEATAVGVPTKKEEQTINTQLAMREISMMFASPAMGLAEGDKPVNRSHDVGLGLDQSGVSEVGPTNNSLERETKSTADELGKENSGPRNPETRSSNLTGFDEIALQTVAEDHSQGSTSRCDNNRSNVEIDRCESDTLSLFGEAGIVLRDEDPDTKVKGPNFHIYQDSEIGNDKVDNDTLSLFGEAGIVLRGEEPSFAPTDESVTIDLETSDAQALNQGRFSFNTVPEDPPEFGDISNIASTVDITMAIGINIKRAVDYRELHRNDTKTAAKRLRERGSGCTPTQASLFDALSTTGLIYDLSTHVVPRSLKGKQLIDGTQVKVGNCCASLKQELGRGVYGVVALLEIPGRSDMNKIAVKSQSPLQCLAWEYEILEKLVNRTRECWKEVASAFPFPNPISFVNHADGAILGMTAASSSGLNLVDLVNVYTVKLGEKVPEIIALHYTARMLNHLEVLHWHGKILHCDAKPDNWVLTASEIVSNEQIDSSDLKLVDFGRAVDLDSSHQENVASLDTTLVGEASSKNMMCVAMRRGLPWSFDIDTFGVCAAAHVLLFGSHIELNMTKNKRYMPQQRLPRNFQTQIWKEVFDTLLNLDEVTGVAVGSRPRSLRQLRNRIEEYLKQQNSKLEAALKHQATILPSKRYT